MACWDNPCFTLDIQAGETYYFMVTSRYGMGGDLHVNCATSPAPANDDFDNATTITALPFSDFINTRGATSAPDDPTDCYGTDASVWYELTSITDIRIQVDTSNSDYDTVVAVYTGTRGNLNLMACWDNPCFTLDIQAGETYYFMVTSRYGMGGDLHVNCATSPAPANDDFDNATTITALPFSDFINTRGATSAPDDPTDCYGTDASVWYELTSITDIRIQVDTSNSDYDTVGGCVYGHPGQSQPDGLLGQSMFHSGHSSW